MSSIVAWIQDRIPVSPGALRELTNEPVPNHLKKCTNFTRGAATRLDEMG